MGSLTAVALVHEASRRGVDLTADGDRLRVEAPAGVMTPELLEALRARKVEILEELRRQGVPPPPRIGRCGELVIPFACNERFRWWTAPSAEERELRFQRAREAAGLPPGGLDS